MIPNHRFHQLVLTLSLSGIAAAGIAAEHAVTEHAPAAHATSEHDAKPGPVCEGFGPQTPRDIDNKAGENKRSIARAPAYKEMNLCNIHFHTHAEHKAKAFSIFAGEGEHGHGGGYQCNDTNKLTKAELTEPAENFCKGLKPGETVEVHWVHTSCDVKPGKGLGSCLSESCSNPDLRVESQVFLVVNDKSAMDFTKMG